MMNAKVYGPFLRIEKNVPNNKVDRSKIFFKKVWRCIKGSNSKLLKDNEFDITRPFISCNCCNFQHLVIVDMTWGEEKTGIIRCTGIIRKDSCPFTEGELTANFKF